MSLDPSQHSIEQPPPGMALIYFIQDTDQLAVFTFPIVQVVIDGKVVGANSGNSYFAVAVEPGLHDLYTEPQSPCSVADPEFDHLIAEPDMVYAFRVRLFLAESALEYSSLAPLASNEAANLISSYPQASASYSSGILPAAIRRTSGTVRLQSPPASPLALNNTQAKAVRSAFVHHPAPKNPASGKHRESGKPPVEKHDKGVSSTGGKTTQRTH